MHIEKILNNNVVISSNELQQEIIVLGKGIAFQKKIGDTIDWKEDTKKFVLESQDLSGKYQQIIASIPLEYLSVTDEIIMNIKLKLGKKLSESIYISLTDHIYTAIQRKKQGISLKNAMLWEIKRFYPVEFKLGKESIEIIKKLLEVKLPEDEAGFIAFHIVNAELDDQAQNSYEISKVMLRY
ncbi:PRD domain-containing protein [Enterococcus sp.]|uniref:PRD domain-containing protein n=1 Tax=Enterococcus sp. TaxID=35783 RepID=UPI0025C7124E|nr:PRD domain-containing protein [Enterococcus sp.]